MRERLRERIRPERGKEERKKETEREERNMEGKKRKERKRKRTKEKKGGLAGWWLARGQRRGWPGGRGRWS